MSGTTTLVYDGYCGFCTRSVGWVSRLDRHDRVRSVAHQLPGVRQLQDGVYTWISEHRRLLRGVTSYCQMSPGCTADS